MDKNVLKDEGDYLTFKNQNDFALKLSQIDTNVPADSKKRKSYHRERACIVPYLKALVKASRINFPFTICKSERPDFIISLNDLKKIGIEHRDITTKKYQQYLHSDQQSDQDEFLDKFKIGGYQNDICNSGWVGDEVEQEWALITLKAIEDKLILHNKGHIQDLDTYELLLYSNTHLPNIDKKKAISFLLNQVNERINEKHFARLYKYISFIYGSETWLHEIFIQNS
jgi:hypothetical protein